LHLQNNYGLRNISMNKRQLLRESKWTVCCFFFFVSLCFYSFSYFHPPSRSTWSSNNRTWFPGPDKLTSNLNLNVHFSIGLWVRVAQWLARLAE
jgi:hypothetical protein